jgi:hypothetical protein
MKREDVFDRWNLRLIRRSGICSGIHHRRNHSFRNEWHLVITSLLERIMTVTVLLRQLHPITV